MLEDTVCHTFFSTLQGFSTALHVMLASESLLNCDGLASASAAHQKTMEVLGIELLQNEHVSYVSAKNTKKKTATSKTFYATTLLQEIAVLQEIRMWRHSCVLRILMNPVC